MNTSKDRIAASEPDMEVWIHPSMIDADEIHAIKPDARWNQLFRAACTGESNVFSKYVRRLPAGDGPPLDDPSEPRETE